MERGSYLLFLHINLVSVSSTRRYEDITTPCDCYVVETTCSYSRAFDYSPLTYTVTPFLLLGGITLLYRTFLSNDVRSLSFYYFIGEYNDVPSLQLLKRTNLLTWLSLITASPQRALLLKEISLVPPHAAADRDECRGGCYRH